ncbi:MAG: PD40 domain-containing protein [Planctomycetales bacterium]|nr:PD40 domain-containing protein [Planctomycetales bacterium]
MTQAGKSQSRRALQVGKATPTWDGAWIRLALALACLSLAFAERARAEELALRDHTIGYTELRTNLPGGRHANVRTMRAAVIQGDGSQRRLIAESLADNPDAWTQFAGWSPDGRQAIISRGWQHPDNAQWEEQHQRFRMSPGNWQLDSSLVDLTTGAMVNVTAVDRVSHYNSASFSPDGKRLLMTSLIDGVSKPFVMDLDGRDKRDVSGEGDGFTYGYSASPDGERISYHSNYQIYVADADGSNRQQIPTGHPFNFSPSWSADGQWLLFVSGTHGRSNPHIVRRDGTGLRQLADLNGYQGWVLFLDVPDFHQGSSDVPVWSADGKSVFYTAKVGDNVELFQAPLEGEPKQLTKSEPDTRHYHVTPSPDGRWLLYGSQRGGVRQLFARDLSNGRETQLTNVEAGHAAMWPHWRP